MGRKAADVVEGSVPVPGDGGVPAAVPIDDTTVDDGEMREPNADAALLALAKAQRMNTIVKRNVFVALMGAEDVESAMDRVLKLGLRVRSPLVCTAAFLSPFHCTNSLP